MGVIVRKPIKAIATGGFSTWWLKKHELFAERGVDIISIVCKHFGVFTAAVGVECLFKGFFGSNGGYCIYYCRRWCLRGMYYVAGG